MDFVDYSVLHFISEPRKVILHLFFTMAANSASKIIDQMHHNDPFSLWLNIQRLDEGEGYCTLGMEVRREMLNGFDIVHGGILFSLADSALAFAANTAGDQQVSLETSITYYKPAKVGDTVIAEAKRIHQTSRIGHFEVRISCGEVQLALMKGLVYNTQKKWTNE